jgi:hypothetical protein
MKKPSPGWEGLERFIALPERSAQLAATAEESQWFVEFE